MSDDGHFDESLAATYDDDPDAFDPATVDPAVDFLAGLAGTGPALEFAVGTGRIALPLAARGVAVHGIELSRAMAARLAAKPGGADIPVTIGDMATTRVPGSFRLVYLVFTTLMNLTTQAAQVACFRNAAAHLAAGGAFVIEVMVPRLRQLPPGQPLHVFRAGAGHWGIDEYDTVNQGLVSHHILSDGGATRRYSMPCRYVWPAGAGRIGYARRSAPTAMPTSRCGVRRLADRAAADAGCAGLRRGLRQAGRPPMIGS